MPSLSEAEIRGDWNNIKGTEYHFVYALWLLIRAGAASVAFYRGNDLLATPSKPPVLRGEDNALPAVPVKTEHNGRRSPSRGLSANPQRLPVKDHQPHKRKSR